MDEGFAYNGSVTFFLLRIRTVLISCAAFLSVSFFGEVFADETKAETVSETPVVFETASGSAST